MPIAKIEMPSTEDDLRPIFRTQFFSKVTEHFVVVWLLDFILSCQDSTDGMLSWTFVDFPKAFNRQTHNILISKLYNVGVMGGS